jgi:hypothetical protein
MTKPADPLAPIEAAQAVFADTDATLDQLETARLELQRVVAGSEADVEEIGSRRKIELLAHAPAAELNRKLEALEKAEKEVSRRSEIANAILGQLALRIAAALDQAAEEKRRTNYAAALALHDETAKRIKEFCDRVAPETAEVLRVYAESELATFAANKDRPAGAPIIPSIEQERQGGPTPPRITERHFKAFVRGQDFVCEVGRVEAVPTGGNTWNLFLPSNSVQGGTSVGGCELVDFVDLKIERFEPQRPPSLVSSLSIPEFFAPAPIRGAIEKKRMRLDDWRAINGEPAEHFPALAAE